MSKPFIKKPTFIEKGIYNPLSIPDILKDEIEGLAKAGEYGKLEQVFANYPTELSKSNNLLHSIIQSSLTDIQITEVIKLLLKRGVAINTLDDSGLPPIYYAIKLQLYNVTKLLIDRKANLNIKLPKGYDLFRTSLIPSIMQCPVELRDVHDDINIGKYYAQTSELERNLRQEILKLPNINTDFITKLLEYIKQYPTIGIEFYDSNRNEVKTIYDTNVEEEEIKIILPTYTHDIHDKVNKLPTEFKSEQQLIADLPAIISDLSKKFKDSLKVKQLENLPKVKDYIIPAAMNYPQIYNNLFTIDNETNQNKLSELITKYWEQITDNYNNFKNDFRTVIAVGVNPAIDIEFANLDIIIGVPPIALPPNIYDQLDRVMDISSRYLRGINNIMQNNDDYENYPNVNSLFNNFIYNINNLSSVSLLKQNNDFIFNQKLLFNNLAEYIADGNTLKLLDANNNPGVLNRVSPPLNIFQYVNLSTSNNPPDFAANPNNQYGLNIGNFNQLQVFLEWYHQEIYNAITVAPAFDNLLQKFQRENATINPEVAKLRVLKSLNSAINKTFIEMVNLVINSVSKEIVFGKLKNTPFATDINKIFNTIQKRLEIEELNKRDTSNYYYLDENYTNGEKIDKLTCLNNNVELIRLLRRTIHVNVSEYSDLIIKLGNPDVITAINDKNKITKLELTKYLNNHDEKFKLDITYLNMQVKEDLTKNQLNLFKNFNTFIFDRTANNIRINNKPYRYDVIYTDLINNQVLANQYLVSEITIKLNNLFENNIIPTTKEFLNYYINGELDTVLDYTALQPNLQPIISDIIYYHLHVNPNDPNKPKDTKTLDEIVQNYSMLFLNDINEDSKVNIITNYNDKFRSNLITYLTITSGYYLNIYRNQLRYIFNKVRYSKLDIILN